MNKPNSMLLKIVLGFFLLVASFSSLAQTIFKGTVADNDTGEGIPYATVFLTNTTFGVSADETGNFKMVIPDVNYDLRVRMLGYISLTFQLERNALKHQGYGFRLIPAEEELDLTAIKISRFR